jgi:hypothetical protein
MKAEIGKAESRNQPGPGDVDGRWTVDAMWERRNREHVAEIAFHPQECRALRALTAVYCAQREREAAERMAPNGFCHACGVAVGPTVVYCLAHYPRALTRPKKVSGLEAKG